MAWGLTLTAVIHALLWLLFLGGIQQPRPPQPQPGKVLTVALLAPPAPAPAMPQAGPAPSEPVAPPPQAAAAPVREELHYYFPEELDRQLIVLRDHSGDAEIDLPFDVVMDLFVDVLGHVVAIRFDGEAPAPELQAQLRKAFMSMEFMPGIKQGQPVPARIRIGIAPLLTPAPPAPLSEITN